MDSRASAAFAESALQRYQAELNARAAAENQAADRKPIVAGRNRSDRPFGGDCRSEIQDNVDIKNERTLCFQRPDFAESRQTMTSGFRDPSASAWVLHPSLAGQSASMMAMDTSRVGTDDGTSFASDQVDIKPTFGWSSDMMEETSRRQAATMQAKLNQRLGPEYLSTRKQGGKDVSYLEGWKAIDLANDVFGFNGWSTSIIRLDQDFLQSSSDGRINCCYSAIIRVTLRDGTFHEDTGTGHSENQKGAAAAIEKAKKEAVTDGLKRALKTFGRLMGNCLYDNNYTSRVLKMRAEPPKYDLTQLHRREDTIAPPPAPVPHSEPAGAAHDASSTVGKRSSPHAPSTEQFSSSNSAHGAPNGANRPNNILPRASSSSHMTTAHETENPSALRRSNTASADQSFAAAEQARAREQRRQEAVARQAARQAAAAQGDHSALSSVVEHQRTPEPPQPPQRGSVPPRGPPQLKKAPAGQMPRSPPKNVASSAYASDPSAKWRKPQIKQDPGMMDGMDEASLAAALEASQESTTAAQSAVAQHPHAAKAQVSNGNHRAGSAGRFVNDSEGVDGVTSLSHAAGSGQNGFTTAAKRFSAGPEGGRGQSGPPSREPLRDLDMSEDGAVKRPRHA